MQALNHLPVKTVETISPLDCQLFDAPNLDRIVNYYETILESGDTNSHNYWYLGLAYLLQEREIDAQATWFIPFEEADELESVALNSELSIVLDRSAAQEFAVNNLDRAWLIGQYLREVDPTHLNNLVRSILIEIKLDRFSPDILGEWAATEIVSTNSTEAIDRNLRSELLRSLLGFLSDDTCNFIKACLGNQSSTSIDSIDNFEDDIMKIAHRIGANLFMVDLLEFYQVLHPNNHNIANALCRTYSDMGNYKKAIEVGQANYNLCDDILDKIQTNYPLIITYLTAGCWNQADSLFQQYQELLE